MLDPEVSQKVFQQFLDIWVLPEMERRKTDGTLPGGFSLNRAQVLMFPDERKPMVRLNEEVRAIAVVKSLRQIKEGENIAEKDISEIKSIQLTSEDDPNAGHFTGLLIKGEWVLLWDFRYNKGKARETVEAAKQFLEAAKLSLKDGKMRPFADNLFSAFELFATAQLLIIPDPKYTKKQTHAGTRVKYNGFARLGNFKPEYATALNKLSGFRSSARYLKGEFSLSSGESAEYVKVAEDMLSFTSNLVA